MKDGYIRIAAGSVDVRLADPEYNKEQILARLAQAHDKEVNLLVLPELCLTGATCGDLFLSTALQDAALRAAQEIVLATESLYPVVIFGLPLTFVGCRYNCAVVAQGGKVLGIVAKSNVPNDQARWFCSGEQLGDQTCTVTLAGQSAPFGSRMTFRHEAQTAYSFTVQIGDPAGCADVGVVAVPMASAEQVGGAERCRLLMLAASARDRSAYACAGASHMESTRDSVFASHHLIAQDGRLVAENEPFGAQELIVCDVDAAHLSYDRRVAGACTAQVTFAQEIRTNDLTYAKIEKNPFLPCSECEKKQRAKTILDIQSHALARRLSHVKAKTAVIGVSGGLDSTVALLVAVRAMKLLGRSKEDVVAVTMPCFGTTDRTKSNAVLLCERLSVTLREIHIAAAVTQHFADIGHDASDHSVTFENAQARERTQVLMDVANQTGGIVIGTGDLSELALGWATYNGDHMSMYGVNAGVPKTVLRELVRFEADTEDGMLSRVLWDILDTPVSPELLPMDEKGDIAQKTEDLVGPYELHDFFLHYMVRYGDAPDKIFRLARHAFAGEYEDRVILHWLRVFCTRFFAQQFKRSCLPDGPKVGSVSLSPRGDWQMPTDAFCTAWLRQIDEIEHSL